MGQPTLFLVLWSILVFGFFSVSQTKLPTYIFPMFPTTAVLAGQWMAWQSERQKARASSLFETLLVFLPLWLYVLICVALLFILPKQEAKFSVAPITSQLWTLTLIVGIALSLLLWKRSGVWLVPGTWLTLFLLIAWCSPTWKTREADVSERKLAAVAAQTSPPDGVFHALGFKHPSLRFYANRPVIYTDDHPASAEDIRQHPGVVYAMRTKDEDELRVKYGVTNYEELWRYDRTVLIRATWH